MLGCLRALGDGLVVRRGRPEDELCALAAEVDADAVLWTSDVSGFARARDARVAAALRGRGVEAIACGGNHVVDDVAAVRTRAGGPYRVFSPFWRTWRELPRRPALGGPTALPAASGLRSEPLPPARDDLGLHPRRARRARGARALARRPDRRLRRGGRDQRAVPVPALGLPLGARVRAARACARRRRAPRRGRGSSAGATSSPTSWPTIPATCAGSTASATARWPGSATTTLLAAWREGATGFPLVDAGMRQLAADRLDAQPAADGRRLVLDQGPAPRLAAGGGALRAAAARRRAGPEQRQLAVDRLGRRRSRRRSSSGSSTRRCRPGASTPTATTSGAGCPSWRACRRIASTIRVRRTGGRAAIPSRSSTTRSSAAARSSATPRRPEGKFRRTGTLLPS